MHEKYSVQWLIEPSKNFRQTVDFYKETIGLECVDEGVAKTDIHFHRYAQFRFSNGFTLEIVEPKEQYKEIFVHSIPSLRVDDLEQHCKRLRQKGVVFISDVLDSGEGLGWTYFEGTDGIIMQLEGPYRKAD